jgi:hypothetical protein
MDKKKLSRCGAASSIGKRHGPLTGGGFDARGATGWINTWGREGLGSVMATVVRRIT